MQVTCNYCLILAPLVVFFGSRGCVFVLPVIPRVVTHLQGIGTMGSIGLTGHVEQG
jgi:hypothetical protein